jgi:hypothetical protein
MGFAPTVLGVCGAVAVMQVRSGGIGDSSRPLRGQFSFRGLFSVGLWTDFGVCGDSCRSLDSLPREMTETVHGAKTVHLEGGNCPPGIEADIEAGIGADIGAGVGASASPPRARGPGSHSVPAPASRPGRVVVGAHGHNAYGPAVMRDGAAGVAQVTDRRHKPHDLPLPRSRQFRPVTIGGLNRERARH